MSQARPTYRSSRHSYQSSPSFAWSNPWVFFASWRGQLIVCGIAIVLGGILFILQEPFAKFRQRRREAISKKREKELMSMEAEQTVGKADDVKEKDKKGKDKKRDQKKRKGSLLRVPGDSSANVSSIEGSPRPSQAQLSKSGSTSSKPTLPATNLPNMASTPTKQTSNPSIPTLLEPSPTILNQPSERLISPAASPDPKDIPLPVTPIAGPSRLPRSNRDYDQDSIDDGDHTSDSGPSGAVTSDAADGVASSSRSLSFSIIPEEGYLPAQTNASNTKKKKRKSRASAPLTLTTLERRKSESTDIDGMNQPVAQSPKTPMTPSRHARKASLTRPPNADLEALLTEREKMIDALRAEIGLAKAEEAKARDSAVRMNVTIERIQGDYERARKMSQRVDHEGRRREGELNARLTHLSTQYATALNRINHLEAIVRESGQPFPPVSPGLPIPGHSPNPMQLQYLQSIPSPMPPSSPFVNGFGPSPRAVSAGFVPYPSPGMYPSPMLHPHYLHSHSPSPFRRASTANGDESLAGALTPGVASNCSVNGGSGSYPFDLGIMPPPAPAQPPSTGPPSAADLRRMSIESSVLKKKKDTAKSDSENGEDRALEPLQDVDETGPIGLGVGDMDIEGSSDMKRDETAEGSRSGSSHPSSPSPPNRTTMLLTPSSADLYHRTLLRGTDTPEDYRINSHVDLSEIKVIPDGENGTLYFTARPMRQDSGSSLDRTSDNVSAYEPEEMGTGEGREEGQEDGQSEGEVMVKEDYVPMFASLAHTPQQLREIKQMREKVIRARESRSSSQSKGSIVG